MSLNPASSSQLLISLKLKVSPRSVLTSMFTANINPLSGSVRSSFTSHSPIARVAPPLSAGAVFLSNLRLRASPSLSLSYPQIWMEAAVIGRTRPIFLVTKGNPMNNTVARARVVSLLMQAEATELFAGSE